MNYELARKLKEAGFSQDGKTGSQYYPEGENGDKIIIPTLSDLIEALGYDFSSLSQQGTKQWEAKSLMKRETFEASNPEEAVAGLWLKLNNK